MVWVVGFEDGWQICCLSQRVTKYERERGGEIRGRKGDEGEVGGARVNEQKGN